MSSLPKRASFLLLRGTLLEHVEEQENLPSQYNRTKCWFLPVATKRAVLLGKTKGQTPNRQTGLCKNIRSGVWKSYEFQLQHSLEKLPSMQETRVWSLGWGDSLEKEMATHSSILACEIPWTEGDSPWGHKRVWHNLGTEQQWPQYSKRTVILFEKKHATSYYMRHLAFNFPVLSLRKLYRPHQWLGSWHYLIALILQARDVASTNAHVPIYSFTFSWILF